MGLLYGIMFLVLVMNFDKSIHRQCEKTGFELEPSRKYKFYLFFLCIGLMSAISIYYMSQSDYWITPLSWILNMTDTEVECAEKLVMHSQNTVGLAQTFFYTNVLFFMIGMGFGTSYSIAYVNPFEWVHTRFSKRLARGVLGVGLVIGLETLIQKFVRVRDQSTVYIIHRAIPVLLFSLFIYGCFPIICQKCGLVDKEADIENKIQADEEAPVKKLP